MVAQATDNVQNTTPQGYARIRRGPMAADQFTQVSNNLFRDPRLSMKAKGLFGLISTHRDGYGITLKTLAAFSTDGVYAVRNALQELQDCGYCRHGQSRNADGTFSEPYYYITDMPELPADDMPPLEPEPENPRSEPICSYPISGNPTSGNHTHKKTRFKNTKVEEEEDQNLSPRERALGAIADALPDAGAEERELILSIIEKQVTNPSSLLSYVQTVIRKGDLGKFKPKGVRGVYTAEDHDEPQPWGGGWGEGWDPAAKPSVTDARVQQAVDSGKRLDAKMRAQGWTPYQNPAEEDRALYALPLGAEAV